jgi:hypothetical protein
VLPLLLLVLLLPLPLLPAPLLRFALVAEPDDWPLELPVVWLPLRVDPEPWLPPSTVQAPERQTNPVLQTTLLQHGSPCAPQGGGGVEPGQAQSAKTERQHRVQRIGFFMVPPSRRSS